MTADDARQFLQSLNVFMAEDCYESDIDEDAQKVIALVDAERERCARIIESAGMYLSGDQEDARESDLLSLANKIRSGE